MDALAHHLPVVATDVGGIPEIIIHQETGLLVPPADPGALADSIAWMLSNRSRAKALAESGCQRVEKSFSAAAMVQGNRAVYGELLKTRGYKNGNT
jgi:glycosyltransferase involved in cell wall biosynthesis